jgi:hypothetical protein
MTQVGFVYKLCSIDPEVKEIYVGSTKNLRVRKNLHKSKCNNESDKEHNKSVYQFIRANGGFSNWDVIQLERVEFNTRHELNARERHYFELLKATLNKQVPSRTRNEWRCDNHDELKEYLKNYNKDNEEKIKEQKKQNYVQHKKEILEKQKTYRKDNKEKIFENQKTYREDNKEKIKIDYQKRKDVIINCECGCKYTYYGKTSHLRSKKHQNYVNSII